MLRDRLLGIGQIVRTMNDWLVNLAIDQMLTLVRYEDLRSSPIGTFLAVSLMAVVRARRFR
jgi:hypothetical protein